MNEPSPMLRRLIELERRLKELEMRESESAAKAGNARHQGVFHAMLMNDFVLALASLVTDRGQRDVLIEALEDIRKSLPDHPGIPSEVVREYDLDIRAWQHALRESPPASLLPAPDQDARDDVPKRLGFAGQERGERDND